MNKVSPGLGNPQHISLLQGADVHGDAAVPNGLDMAGQLIHTVPAGIAVLLPGVDDQHQLQKAQQEDL